MFNSSRKCFTNRRRKSSAGVASAPPAVGLQVLVVAEHAQVAAHRQRHGSQWRGAQAALEAGHEASVVQHVAVQQHLGAGNGLARLLCLLLALLLHAAAGVPEHEHQEGAQQDEQAVVEEEILEVHEEGRLSGAAAQTSGRVGVKASRNYRSSNLSV